MLMAEGTIQKITFGKMISPSQKPGEILGLGKKHDTIYAQVQKAAAALKSHALPLDEWPYGDKVRALQGFAGLFSCNARTRRELIERVIQSIGPTRTKDPLQLEPERYAVSILRRKGINAYPAFALQPGENGEPPCPLIALLEPSSEVPLKTFHLNDPHPPMSSLEVISDAAMQGLYNLLGLGPRLRCSTAFISQMAKGAVEIIPDTLIDEAIYVGRTLEAFNDSWPDLHFMKLAFQPITYAAISGMTTCLEICRRVTKMLEF
jgi:hypothetical protein